MEHAGIQPYLWMLLGSFAFAWMGIFAHEAGADYDWQVIAVIRCALPLGIVGLLALARGTPLVFLRPATLWLRSVAGSLSLLGTFYVLPLLPVSDVFTITNIFPLWIALLSWPMLGEKPTGQVWLSIFCGILGVALIQQPYLAAGNYLVLVPLAVSFCTALAMMGLHRLKGVGTIAVVVHFHMVALCFALAALLLANIPIDFKAPAGWTFVQLAGVGLAAIIGQFFLTLAFTHGEPARVAVVGLTQIVFTLILDSLVLGQPLEGSKLLGVPLVIAPTAWLMVHHRLQNEDRKRGLTP